MKLPARIILFIISYIPLLICAVIQQIAGNWAYLHFCGFHAGSILTFFEKFGLSLIIGLAILISIIGFWVLKKNIDKDYDNGINVKITKVDDKSTDTISYIATFLFPLLFQHYDSFSDGLCLLVILIALCPVYINSPMLMINPLLNIWYSFYNIEYKTKNELRNGILMTKKRDLDVCDNYKIYPISKGMYYGR